MHSGKCDEIQKDPLKQSYPFMKLVVSWLQEVIVDEIFYTSDSSIDISYHGRIIIIKIIIIINFSVSIMNDMKHDHEYP